MIRAAVSDPELLALSGVNVRWLFTGVFMIGASLAGFAGSIITFEGSFDSSKGEFLDFLENQTRVDDQAGGATVNRNGAKTLIADGVVAQEARISASA